MTKRICCWSGRPFCFDLLEVDRLAEAVETVGGYEVLDGFEEEE